MKYSFRLTKDENERFIAMKNELLERGFLKKNSNTMIIKIALRALKDKIKPNDTITNKI